MRKYLSAAIAAALILPMAAASPAIAAQNHGQQVSTAAHATHAAQAHRFKRGEKFDRAKATNYRVVSYRDHRQLSAPPSGYRWVRSGRDAVLVRISTGIVRSVVINVF